MEIGDERAIEPFVEALLEFQTQREASKALQAVGSKAEEAVLKYLKNSDPGVRAEACRILKVIGTRKSIGPLQPLVRDKAIGVSGAARDALRTIEARRGK